MTAPFISDTDLGIYLNRDLADDDLAAIVLDSACEVVRNFCGQGFDLVEDDTVRLSGSGLAALVLPQLPVVSVASVKTNADTATTTTLTETTDYVVDLDRGLIHRTASRSWGVRPQSIEVVYSHGYSSVPSDVRLVALHVAARLHDHAGMEQENLGAYSGRYESGSVGLTAVEKSVLRKYRRVVA